MYRTNRETFNGLAKNATEGMAAPAAIVPWTVMLLAGQVLPLALLVALLVRGVGSRADAVAAVLCGAAVVASYAVRLTAASRFRQSLLGAIMHSLGVLILVLIQWVALLRRVTGGARPGAGGRTTCATLAPAAATGAKRRARARPGRPGWREHAGPRPRARRRRQRRRAAHSRLRCRGARPPVRPAAAGTAGRVGVAGGRREPVGDAAVAAIGRPRRDRRPARRTSPATRASCPPSATSPPAAGRPPPAPKR
jgi:hypothetical protein